LLVFAPKLLLNVAIYKQPKICLSIFSVKIKKVYGNKAEFFF
jgi:hypothetical protein